VLIRQHAQDKVRIDLCCWHSYLVHCHELCTQS
jgi:hypothetical protein